MLCDQNLTLLHAIKKAQTSLRIHAVCSASLLSYLNKLATCKVSIFFLVSVVEQADLSLPWSETQKTVIYETRLNVTLVNSEDLDGMLQNAVL